MQGVDLAWKQGSQKRQEVIGSDHQDFRFFVFISIFIFFLAGVVFVVTGASSVG